MKGAGQDNTTDKGMHVAQLPTRRIIHLWPSIAKKNKLQTPNVGLEPTTLRLRVSCSTDWASQAYIAYLISQKISIKRLHLFFI